MIRLGHRAIRKEPAFWRFVNRTERPAGATLAGVSLALERQMSDKEEQAKRRLYEISKGFLIWGAAAVIGIGLLYLLSVWVNHDPLRP